MMRKKMVVELILDTSPSQKQEQEASNTYCAQTHAGMSAS
jgi:hypothetical protein